jgi:hypothetical protein
MAKTFAETSENENESKDFEIGDPVILFEILRSSMYKDPILTVLREIGTNARDANREVGKDDVPIRIKLPTQHNPQLIIEDDGPGISPERMDNVFRKFGKSTKRHTNNLHGGFGIGGKSIFAYTDTYTCITVNDGIKYTYFGYIGENRLGTYDLKFSEPTTESSGTKFFIPVKEEDIKTFAKTVVNIVKFWDVKPIITPEVNLPTYQYFLSKNNWAFAKRKDYYDYSTPVVNAIVDGIPYAVDKDSLRIKDSNKFAFLFDRSVELHIRFDNADLALAAPRDSLNYNDYTVGKLTQCLEEIVASLKDEAQKAISAAPTYLEAVKIKKQLSSVFTNTGTPLCWNNLPVIGDFNHRFLGLSGTINSFVRDRYDTKIKRSNISANSNSYNTIHLGEVENQTFVLLDNEAVLKQIADHFLSANPKVTVIIVTPGENIAPQNLEILKQFCVLSSSIVLDKQVRNKKDKIKAEDDEVLVYDHARNYQVKPTVRRESVDNGVLFYIYDYKTNCINPADLLLLNNVDFSSFDGYKNYQILGLTENRAASLPKDISWKRISDVIPKLIEDKLKSYDQDTLELCYLYNNDYQLRKWDISYGNNCYIKGYIENNYFKLENTLLSQWVLLCKKITTSPEILDLFTTYLRISGKTQKDHEDLRIKHANFHNEFKDLIISLNAKYPLAFRYNNLEPNELAHYMNLFHGE